MMEWWPAILGWPAIILAIAMGVIGVMRHKPALPIVAAVLLLPITLYLVGSPRIGWMGLLPPALLLGSAAATWKGQSKVAWLCLIPVMAVVVWFAVLVASN